MINEIMLIGIPPVFTERIWVEQLLDHLSARPSSEIFIPKIQLETNQLVETNAIYELLVQQFPKIKHYEVRLPNTNDFYFAPQADSIKGYEFVQKYLQKTGKELTLYEVNSEINILLSSQFSTVINPEYLEKYQEICNIIDEQILKTIQKFVNQPCLFLVDIEHLKHIMAKLNEVVEYRVFDMTYE